MVKITWMSRQMERKGFGRTYAQSFDRDRQCSSKVHNIRNAEVDYCRHQRHLRFLKFFIFSVPSRITRTSDNQTVNEGSNLTLFCNATGKPAPNITWTRVSEDETLFVGNPWHIVNINRTYNGTYRCVADNGVPSAVNSTISVNVVCEYTLYFQLMYL